MSQSQSLPLVFGGVPPELSEYETARALIWPVPLEKTVSYGGGTGRGPAAIIDASRNVELFDEELWLDTSRIGIHTLPALDVSLPLESLHHTIYLEAKRLLDSGKFLCSLGGEHALSGPIVKAFSEKFSGLSVLQIDAHADLRDTYDDTPYSHACAMRRALEYCPAVQVGIRSISEEEIEALPSLNTRIFFAKDIHSNDDWMDQAIDALTSNVYLTIDVDGLDPSIIPSTGTPEPGGLSWYTTLTFLRKLTQRRKVVGMDVVELSPIDAFPAPDFAVAKLVYKTLGYVLAASNTPAS